MIRKMNERVTGRGGKMRGESRMGGVKSIKYNIQMIVLMAE